MPVRMLPPPPPDNRLAEINSILQSPSPVGDLTDRRRTAPPHQMKLPFPRASVAVGETAERRSPRQLVGAALSAHHRRIEHNLVAAANATMAGPVDRASARQHEEDERMAIVEGERERQLIHEAEHYAELAFLRAKGAV